MHAPNDEPIRPASEPAEDEGFDGALFGWDRWLIRMYVEALSELEDGALN